MNYSALLSQAWRRVWQCRLLWLLGMVASLGTSVAALFRLWLSSTIPGHLSALETGQTWPEGVYLWVESLLAAASSRLVIGLVAFVFLLMGLWLAMTVAEGGLIYSVLQLEQGQQPGCWEAFGAGRRLLARLIGIDTILFFPLFLLLLLSMLLLTAMLIGVAMLSMQGTALEPTLLPLVVGAICLVPVCLVLLPSLIMTALLRKLAFRYTVITDAGVGNTIRHSWRLFRNQVGQFLLLFAILWGIGYLVNLFLGLLTVPMLGLGAISWGTGQGFTWSLAVTWFFAVVFAMIILFLLALTHAYVATAWTMACRQLIGTPALGSDTSGNNVVQLG